MLKVIDVTNPHVVGIETRDEILEDGLTESVPAAKKFKYSLANVPSSESSDRESDDEYVDEVNDDSELDFPYQPRPKTIRRRRPSIRAPRKSNR
jgi:hypothetical protein